MAKRLKLQTQKQADGSIVVSWRDPIKLEAHPRLKQWHRVFFSVWFLAGAYLLYLVYFDNALWSYFQFHLTLYWVAPNLKIYAWGYMVMGLIMAGVTASLSPSLRNQVRIAKDRFTHRKFSVPTSSITRFEYGTKEQLTGAKEVGLDSKTLHNPTIIRLWVGDATAYEISRNNWQTQVNHEIQTALTKALETVRDFDKQQKHAQEFGTVSTDTGMPDY